jgi:hypothetical protein
MSIDTNPIPSIKRGRKKGSGKWEEKLKSLELQATMVVTQSERQYLYSFFTKLRKEGLIFQTFTASNPKEAIVKRIA